MTTKYLLKYNILKHLHCITCNLLNAFNFKVVIELGITIMICLTLNTNFSVKF